MSGFAGGPPPGAHRDAHRGSAGALPVLLLAALAAALFIGVTLGAVAMTSAGGGGSVPVEPATATAAKERVRLAIRFQGGGRGKVEITPGDVLCTRTCERRFATGTTIVAVAEPAEGSTFDGWGDACDGAGRCSFVIDEDRSLSLTFETDDRRTAAPCDRERDAECAERPADRPVTRSDCHDGLDNDGDGLTDAQQDPGCDDDNTEADGPAPAAPASTTVPGDCADGRDNDGDGLTDTEQDPDCLEGDTESGRATSTAREPRARQDCNDGRDNDGDGLIDSEQDPGCEGDGTEAD